MDDPKELPPMLQQAIVYMNKRLQCKKRDSEGNLVFLTLEDLDMPAWMCGWDACFKYLKSLEE